MANQTGSMSRRLADDHHPGRTRPITTTQVKSVTTSSTTPATQQHPQPRLFPSAEPPHSRRASSSTTTTPGGMGSNRAYSELRLAPATQTSVVTTTTTTTVHFAPILIPRSKRIRPQYSSFSVPPPPASSTSSSNATTRAGKPPLTPRSTFAHFIEKEESGRRDSASPSSTIQLDPKMYPLSQSTWPGGSRRFKLALGNLMGEFYEDGSASGTSAARSPYEQVAGGADLSFHEGTAAHPSAPSTITVDVKGKAKESQQSSGTIPVTLASSVAASLSTPPSRNDRGPTAARRRSRRAGGSARHGPSSTNAGGSSGGVDSGDGQLEDDSDEDGNLLSGDEVAGAAAGGRLPSPGPPRKRPRAGSHVLERSTSVESDLGLGAGGAGACATAPNVPLSTAATLPSPNMSPPSPVPTFVGDGDNDDEEDGVDCVEEGQDKMMEEAEGIDLVPDLPQFDLGSGHAISGLLSLPDFVDTFDQLPPAVQSYFIFTFLKRSSIPVLQTINNIIAPSLRRDFLTDLPPELGVHILGYLDSKALCRASVVCKGWRRLVDGEWRVWKERLVGDGLWIGDGSEEKEAKEIAGGKKENLFLKRWKAGVWDENARGTWNGREDESGIHVDGIDAPSPRRFSTARLASPSSSRESSPFSQSHFVHPFKTLYRRRFVARRNWKENEPTRVQFACHANNVVTCLQFDADKIVSASDDHSINVFSTKSGAQVKQLSGHDGGVWALQYIGNILVSGSTDRTVRVWDLDTGECTHVFVGHTSTVRCLQIVEPENINPDPHGDPIWEPPYPLIVTGSRDWSLRVWRLPSPGKDSEYHPTVPMSPTEENTDPSENPFHLRHLSGHRHAVRALAAHGRTLVSGSYDCSVRVWDVLTGECKHRLTGHSQKVYSVVLDHKRQQCASGSMDGTVRLWSTETGECKAMLEGHSSLVGLLGLSPHHLVSAAADSTLRIWDPSTGDCRHTLAAHSGAITCFQHDEYKVISGSDGTLKLWDVRDGTFTRDLLTGLTGVWQVSFDQRFCIAAVQRNGQSEFEILDFGAVDPDEPTQSTVLEGRFKEEIGSDEELLSIIAPRASSSGRADRPRTIRPVLSARALNASASTATPSGTTTLPTVHTTPSAQVTPYRARLANARPPPISTRTANHLFDSQIQIDGDEDEDEEADAEAEEAEMDVEEEQRAGPSRV